MEHCLSTIQNHASSKTFNYCQFSTSATEILLSKYKLEELAANEGFKIVSYHHSDNGVFVAAEYKEDCDQQDQIYSFSGVWAHHQNGVAEQNVQTVAQ